MIRVECEHCNKAIEVKEHDFHPRQGTWKDLQCPHCQGWMTFSVDSRFLGMPVLLLSYLAIFAISAAISSPLAFFLTAPAATYVWLASTIIVFMAFARWAEAVTGWWLGRVGKLRRLHT